MQLLSVKARNKRDSLIVQAHNQEVLYQRRMEKGDFEGAAKALKRRDEILRKARYSAYRQTKHTT